MSNHNARQCKVCSFRDQHIKVVGFFIDDHICYLMHDMELIKQKKNSLYLKAFIQNLIQIGTVVSEKIQFDFLYVHDLWPRSRKVLDLQYSHIVIYSIRCLLLLPFRSLAAIVSEKSTVFTFSHRKA